jgi:hypothetical protein
MYTHSTSSAADDSGLATLACRAFVALSVIVSGIGFWHKGLLPFVLLSIFMVSTVYLLSISLTRMVASYEKDWRMFGQTLVLSIGFALLEGFLNHIGLEHLNRTYALGPVEFATFGSALLPLVNVFATDTYTRELPKEEKTTGNSRPSAEAVVFGLNLKERESLRQITERMKANGSM